MPPVGFEPTISASERRQSYVLGRAATGTGVFAVYAPFSFLPACLPASLQYFILNLLTAYFFIFCHNFTSLSPYFSLIFFIIIIFCSYLYLLFVHLPVICTGATTGLEFSLYAYSDMTYCISITIRRARNFGARVAQSVKELTQDRMLGVIFSINETPVSVLIACRQVQSTTDHPSGEHQEV